MSIDKKHLCFIVCLDELFLAKKKSAKVLAGAAEIDDDETVLFLLSTLHVPAYKVLAPPHISGIP